MKLYYNATILTVNKRRDIWQPGALLTCGNRIADIGESEILRQRFPEAQQIDCKGNILLPGLINTHIHLAQCLGRGIADDLDVLTWLTKRVWPMQCNLTPELFLTGAKLNIAEMLLGGTTTFVDPMVLGRYGIEGYVNAVLESGMRGMLARVVMEPLPGSLLPKEMTETKEDSFREAISAFENWNNVGDGRVGIWIAPRWTAMFNERLMEDVRKVMDQYGFMSTLHYAETDEDVTTIKKETGMTPGEFLRAKGLSRKEMMLVHCVKLPGSDDKLLAEDGVSLAYCTIGNMKLAMGNCRAYELKKAGVNVTIGTDATACDNNSDMLLAMRMTSIVQKNLADDPTVMSAEEILEMATINSARALDLEEEIGSLEVGKKADFILIDTYKPRLRPAPNPVSAVVFAASSEDVAMTVVDGKILVKDSKLLTFDVPDLIDEADAVMQDMRARLNIGRSDLTSWHYCD